MTHLLANNDRFGFYKVNDFKTYSKLEAIEYSGKVNKPVEWNFNKEIFEQIDWTQEPPGSLEFWYGERARQIREKYDYIVLWYSGGSDSHNALMSFVKNDIFIDEIAHYHNLEGERGDKKAWLNEEIFSTSAPITQHLIENNPIYKHTHHRLVDLTELQKDVLLKDGNNWDYFYMVGKFLSPNALARSYLREVIPDYLALIEKGKSVCFIYGAEKPVIEQHPNNQWYVSFSDSFDYGVSPRTQILNRGWEHNEFFYWSDSLPQLVSKQAHIVKRFLTNLTPQMVDNVHISTADPSSLGNGTMRSLIASSVVINKQPYHLLFHGLNKLIYPYYDPTHIVCKKPPSLAYSSRDHWMFKSNAPDMGQKNYNYGLINLKLKVKNANSSYWYESGPDIGPYSGGMVQFHNKYRIS